MAGVAVAATSKCAPQPNPLVLGQSCRLEQIPHECRLFRSAALSLASNDSRIAKADASVVTRAAFFRIFSTLAMGLQREKKNANSRNYVNQASPCYTDSADVRAHGLSPYNALGIRMHVLGVIVAAVGVVAVIALNFAWFIAYGRFVKHLELNHHEHWKSVGSPVQFEDEPQYRSFGYVGYFWGRRYVDLGDSELSMLGDRILGMYRMMIVCVLASAMGLAVALGGGG